MADPALLLLDVDGVLVPVGPGDGTEMVEALGAGGGIRYSAALPARLATLAEMFSLVWCTSWGQEANEVLCPLFGLPPLPVIDFGDLTFRVGQTWKLPTIRTYVRDRPFAAIDDEFGADAHRWASRRSIPTLLLDVRADRGLTQEHVDALLYFAATVAVSV